MYPKRDCFINYNKWEHADGQKSWSFVNRNLREGKSLTSKEFGNFISNPLESSRWPVRPPGYSAKAASVKPVTTEMPQQRSLISRQGGEQPGNIFSKKLLWTIQKCFSVFQ